MKCFLFLFSIFFVISNYSFADETNRRVIVLEGKPLVGVSAAMMVVESERLTKSFNAFSASLSSVIPEAKIIPDSRTQFAIHSVVVELPKEKVRFLDFVENILFHEEDREVRIAVVGKPEKVEGDVSPLLEESVNHIGAKALHQRGIRGAGIRIAIVDTGIDWTHPDLGGGVGEGFKVEKSINAMAPKAPGMDDNGHGTHVAGIAAGVNGVAPDARLWAIKVLNMDGVGFISWILKGIDRALDFDNNPSTFDRADVMNLSLGADGGDPYDSMSFALSEAMLAGVIVAVAAGNSGPNYRTIATPGASRYAITVGASTLLDEVTNFSATGPVIQNSSVKPDIVAPGYRINSSIPGNGYARWSGTSMATPHVAGASALIKEKLIKDGNLEASAFKVKSLLLLSSFNVDADIFRQGYGRLKLDAIDNVPVVFDKPTFALGFWRGGKKSANFGTTRDLSLQKTSDTQLRLTLTESDSGDWQKGASLFSNPSVIDFENGDSTIVALSFSADSKMGSPGAASAFKLPMILRADNGWSKIIPACLAH